MTLELTSEHTERFERDGYTIVRGGFDPTECDHFVDYMSDLQAGRQTLNAAQAEQLARFRPDPLKDHERRLRQQWPEDPHDFVHVSGKV